jgi:ParB-like chromosome segregation protein Spo0J
LQENPLLNLRIEYCAVSALEPYSRNARTHTRHQVHQIANSIEAFGFTNPVLIAGANTIIAGHGRVAAAKLLGMDRVPTIRIEGLSEDEVRAYIIADNRLAEKAGWDRSTLAIELQNLLTIDGDFDVAVTGFEIPEIDLIIEDARDKQQQDRDDLFQIDEASQAVTQLGDLWQLGRHRVLCGNSLDAASFKRLMARRQANLVFVDPPYNVAINGNVSGKGSI